MNRSKTQTIFHNPFQIIQKVYEQSGGMYAFFIAFVLLSLEIFNFSTTQFALQDLLGEIGAGPTTWAAILAIAFCGMNLIGIIRLFTSSNHQNQGNEGWFLLGAWLLAAVTNTGLNWWGVSIAIYNHPVNSVLVVDPMTIVTVIPTFVALIVMLIRILIIGNLASTIRRIAFTSTKSQPTANQPFGVRSQSVQANTGTLRRTIVPQGTHIFSSSSKIEK
ncbi:MAG: hypothetical protein AB2L18_06565 [Anaerolineaceae bacterium]